jgi:hypothetical protein
MRPPPIALDEEVQAIDGLRVGEVATIVGEVEPAERLLVAPLSGRQCVAYQLVIQSSQRQQPRVDVASGRSEGFVVRDDTGRAAVEVGEVSYGLVLDHVVERRAKDAARDEMLRAHGAECHDYFANPHQLGLTEGILVAGARVAVRGRVLPPRGEAVGYRELAMTACLAPSQIIDVRRIDGSVPRAFSS